MYCAYLVKGLKDGFRIGFNYEGHTCSGAVNNMQSVTSQACVVDEYLASEVKAGRVLGPVPPEQAQSLQVNRLGVLPKAHQPGKWRLIVDLSFPKGSSVNDGIKSEECSLHYTSVDEACKRVVARGRGAVLAKFDVLGVFSTVPVHPYDRGLLGMRWRDNIYVDKVLPFEVDYAVAGALPWILIKHDGVEGLHYLDDFLLFGSPGLAQCADALSRAMARCEYLGVPVNPSKTEAPCTKLVFLGIELDTISLTMCLPHGKLEHLQKEIRAWGGKKCCTKRELLSIIGQLQHACCVIKGPS